ncbi:MAG: ankyrin repeat domain-containing protein [Gemmatimonas sp.]
MNLLNEPTRIFSRDIAYFADRAAGLVAVVRDGLPQALQQVRAWHPALGERSDGASLRANFTLNDAKLVYARQHGFPDWVTFAQHLRTIPDNANGEPFLAAFEAAKSRNLEQLAQIVAAHSDVVRARGTNGNTLLNLVSSLTPAPTRQELRTAVTKPERLAGVELLLRAGADVNVANDRGWTVLHQAAYKNDPEMIQLFLTAGAASDVSAHGDGGTPLAVAAFWGHRESVDALAKVAVVPANLRMAASVGRADLIAACFDSNGNLTDSAKANRAFYRPHSGFPDWKPSNDSHEILDEALVWAAKSGRTEIMDLLVQHGAFVEGEPYRGTPLVWAAANGRVDTIHWLLSHGAYPNYLTTFGGLTHGRDVTALHLAAQSNQVGAVRALLENGADPSIKDALYGGTPLGWAQHDGANDVVPLLSAL